jgi:GT2 family glycosyltransferase
MRVLAHIHTLNDAAFIDRPLEGLQRQTRRPDAIIIVDNGSTDATLNRAFPDNVIIHRNPTNLGTSGAIRIGFSYALEHQFDWVWILDADSVPEPEALERLLAFFESLSPAEQGQVCFLHSRMAGHNNCLLEFSGRSIRPPSPNPGARFTRCNSSLWSASLYRMEAVRRIGLPSADYVLYSAELEYGYRAWDLDFVSYMVHDSVQHHGVGRRAGIAKRICQFGPLKLTLYDSSPIRCYYHVRNPIYFWMYQSKHGGLRQVIHSIIISCSFAASFAVRPMSQRGQLIACLRGIWDGLTMHIERRY